MWQKTIQNVSQHF